MSKEKYISAGAGSGKTYTITTEVARLVRDGGLNPDQVIMTTFTKAAAQELREKTKKALVKDSPEKAQQMDHALIGTVHSVANSFLGKYWYLLSILPDAMAMDEEEQERFRDQSLKGILTSEEREFMYAYRDHFNVLGFDKKPDFNFWKYDLCALLNYVQWFNVDEDTFEESRKITESIIRCLYRDKGDLSSVLTDEFYQEVDDFCELATKRNTKVPKAKEFYLSLRDLGKATEISKEVQDGFINALEASTKVDGVDCTLSGDYVDKVKSFIFCCPHDAELHRQYADILYSLAGRWKKLYREYKDRHHLIDFNDMEVMFLELLGKEEVREDIRSSYTHLFVDEFQDSNPIQVKIFRELSSLVETCYVGDKKQAIYGFRGSDTDLTTAVSDSIADKKRLEYSYRSVAPLVDFAGKIFTKVFRSDDVALKLPPRDGNTDHVERPLRIWPYEKDENIAIQIQQFILREHVAPKDIAVLARTNDALDKLAGVLESMSIPVCRESCNIMELKSSRLVKALLTLVGSPGNNFARAEVAYLTAPDYNLTAIIEDRLDFLNLEDENKVYLKNIPILLRFDALRGFKLDCQSVSALLETLVIELDLYGLVRSWDNPSAEEANLQVLIDMAKQYEERATRLADPATIQGFVDFFSGQGRKGAANEDGVCLSTYYKAKGLEWKVVIMLSLDYDPSDSEGIAMREILGCHKHREKLPTYDNVDPLTTVSIVRNVFRDKGVVKDFLISRLQESSLWYRVRDNLLAEAARLLYVGVTRARNILILAPKLKKYADSLQWFKSVGLDVNTYSSSGGVYDIFGNGCEFVVETVNPEIDELLEWPVQQQRTVHDLAGVFSALDKPRNLSPSKVGRSPHDFVAINDKEHRMDVRYGNNDEAQFGNFVHQVFCCMDDGITEDKVKELRSSYGFGETVVPNIGQLFDSWNFLVGKLRETYGESVMRHHEVPFRHRDGEGHIMTGYIDFVWETESGFVIVDYKTYPGGHDSVFKPDSEHFVGCHGDQLGCYRRAIEADGGKPVLATVIYYPVTQFMAEVK